MFVKVFVLGRPGSGKTTAIRHLEHLAKEYGCQFSHIDDYHILKRMFHDPQHSQRFRPSSLGGFDVLDYSVLDEALREIERTLTIQKQQATSNIPHLVAIEFARDDYQQAFQQFNAVFREDAYVLFVEANVNTCIRRVRRRVRASSSSRQHYVSEFIMRTYYNRDNIDYMKERFACEFQLHKAVMVLDNGNNLAVLHRAVNRLGATILQNEFSEYFANEEIAQLKEATRSGGKRDEDGRILIAPLN